MKFDVKSILKKVVMFEANALFALAEYYVHHNFGKILSDFIQKPLSQDEIDNWINNNKSLIVDNFSEVWEIVGKNNQPMMKSFLYVENGDDIFGLISKSPLESPSFKVKNSILLKGLGPIPNLWMYIGSYIFFSGLENINKENASNDFIAIAFTHLFSGRVPASTKNILPYINEFLINNRSKIDQIRKFFVGTPKELDGATDGFVFSIAPNLILKIFKSEFAYQKAIRAMNELHSNTNIAKTEAMIYDAGYLGNFLNEKIYYLIMEKMTPVTNLNENHYNLIKKILRYVSVHIVENDEIYSLKNEDYINTNSIKNKINKISGQFVNDIKLSKIGDLVKKMELELKMKPSWLFNFIQEIIYKYITNRGDLHMGNLGVTSFGELRFFDPSHHSWQQDINMPAS